MKEESVYSAVQISELIVGFRRGTLTGEQRVRLEEWKNANAGNQQIFDQLLDQLNNSDGPSSYQEAYRQFDTASALDRLKRQIRGSVESGARIRTLRRRSQQRWIFSAAAAVALLAVGIVVYLANEQHTPATAIPTMQRADIGPGGNRATLTLSDGRNIDLQEDKDGITVDVGRLTYNDGTALLNLDGASVGTFLELKTPRGGNYQVVLSDGTKVWLNADSRLRYPETFLDDQRIVELEGEAYFEVSHAIARPFIVRSATQEVEVLGTKFNLSAYVDDDYTKTTLLEGAVRVSTGAGKKAVRLMPGQESTWLTGADTPRVQPADIEEAIAWKEGYFRFNDESLRSIMKKISRWYNVDIHYEGEVSPEQVFSGRISRLDSVSGILEALELTGGVRFDIEERRIVVME